MRRDSWLRAQMCPILEPRVVPSRISNLERKRGQYQDYWFVRAKRQRNVASKRRYLRNVWKEPCRGCGFGTFLRFFDILGFAKKTKKSHNVSQKPRNVTKFKIVTLWHWEMSQNVTKCHTFSNLWYKATFTFYVWIRLGTTLIWPTYRRHDFNDSYPYICIGDMTTMTQDSTYMIYV